MARILLLTSFVFLSSGCDLAHRFEERASVVNRYEVVALNLAKENRELKVQLGELRSELESIKSKNNYLALQLEKSGKGDRAPASLAPVVPGNDLVKQKTYKWGPAELMAVAQKEFEKKNFEKSAQFFQTFTQNYPQHEALSDTVLFQAGIAAYESGKHADWVKYNMGRIIKDHPTSAHYRGAKLWLALAHLDEGDSKFFFGTVEEFRKKYRNTSEWDILSVHYEKMLQKYK